MPHQARIKGAQKFWGLYGCQDTSDLARTLRTQDISSAELSRHIGTSAKEDTSAPGNTGPSHGKVDRYACVIMRIRLEQQCYNINA